MDPTHRDRQSTYRFWHPQLNITFRHRSEWRHVLQACQTTGKSPREVLVHWARQLPVATDAHVALILDPE